jgi:hypothetical protein
MDWKAREVLTARRGIASRGRWGARGRARRTMILSSSFLSLPRPLCRDALWRERGAVSDGRGAWCATPPDGVRSNPKWCFWVTIARRAEYSSLEERLRARGARDAGFDDGRLGRTSVPWVAREYLADAGTNATRANRAELSSIGTRSHLCPNQKKNLFSETRIQSERLGFCRTWRARTSVNFLSRRPCPRPLVFPCLQETDGRGNVRVP